MILRLFLIIALLISNAAPTFAGSFDDNEERIMFGIKLQNNRKNNFFLSLERNHNNSHLSPFAESRTIKQELLFTDKLHYSGKKLEISQYNNLNKSFNNYNNETNRLSYSGYQNVEGFRNNSRSQKAKFATASVGTIIVITGLLTGTIIAIANAL